MRRLLVPVLALSAVSLSACGVRADAHYEGPDELREALVDQDFRCHGNTSSFEEGVEFLECDSGIGIYTWEESDSDESEELAAVLGKHAPDSDYVVASDTWAVAHFQQGQALRLQDALGGELIGSDELSDHLRPLQAAYAACDGDGSNWVTYDAEYSVLTVSNAFQEYDSSLSGSGIEAGAAYECVMEEIEAPAHVRDDVARTRALDGTRDITWGDYGASWTFHPDSGLNIQITHES